jgi:hypothetical protein
MSTGRALQPPGTFCLITQRDIPEERNLLLHCCLNLKTGRRSAVVKFIIHEISGEVFVLAEYCMGNFKVYFSPKFNKLCQS